MSLYDTHLPYYILSFLSSMPLRFLTLNTLELIIREMLRVFDIDVAVLGGGEPLLDESVLDVVNMLKEFSISVKVLTNGFYLREFIEKAKLDSKDAIIVSLKALDRDLYRTITGKHNDVVISNILHVVENSTVPLYIEVVHVPDLVDVPEIVHIAEWVKSLRRSVKLIIDAYVPVPGLSLRRPSEKDRLRVCEALSRVGVDFLYRGPDVRWRVWGGYVISRGVRIGFNEELNGNVHLVFPSLKISDVMSVPVSEK